MRWKERYILKCGKIHKGQPPGHIIWKCQRITGVIRVHPVGTMNTWTSFPSNSCWDIWLEACIAILLIIQVTKVHWCHYLENMNISAAKVNVVHSMIVYIFQSEPKWWPLAWLMLLQCSDNPVSVWVSNTVSKWLVCDWTYLVQITCIAFIKTDWEGDPRQAKLTSQVKSEHSEPKTFDLHMSCQIQESHKKDINCHANEREMRFKTGLGQKEGPKRCFVYAALGTISTFVLTVDCALTSG